MLALLVARGAGCGASQDVNRSGNNPAIDRHAFLVSVMELMGTPYNQGGLDCSGFTVKIYGDVLHVTLPRSSQEQYRLGRAVERHDLRFGDLVFFSTTGEGPTHVGIFVGDGLFAHASLGLGVTVSILEDEYYKRSFLGARRIVE